MNRHNIIPKRERQLSETGDAVGVDKKKWFIAIVKNNTELSSSMKLGQMGYETFVPLQDIVYEYNGRLKKRKKVVVSTYLFVHVSDKERRQIVNFPFVLRFLTNISGKRDSFGKHPLAIIPDEEMSKFCTLVEKSETEIFIEATPKDTGEEVEIRSGKLKGLSGHVIHVSEEKHFFILQISCLGCAKVSVNYGILRPKK